MSTKSHFSLDMVQCFPYICPLNPHKNTRHMTSPPPGVCLFSHLPRQRGGFARWADRLVLRHGPFWGPFFGTQNGTWNTRENRWKTMENGWTWRIWPFWMWVIRTSLATSAIRNDGFFDVGRLVTLVSASMCPGGWSFTSPRQVFLSRHPKYDLIQPELTC